MRLDRSTRRLTQVAAAGAAAAVCLTACGLSSRAKSTLSGAASGGAVTAAVAGSAGGSGQGTTSADLGTGAAPAAGDTAAAQAGGAPAAGATTGSGQGSAAGGTQPAGGGTTPVTGSTAGSGTSTGRTTSSSTNAPSGGKSTVAPGKTAAPATQAAASANCSTAGGNATGITPTTINMGLHAPLTGTGTPFPNNSFVAGSKYFWADPAHTICGRKINVDFQDDTYKPSGAAQVCSQFAKTDFIAVGGAGTDQIQACATQPDIDSTGTPYLSAGVTENGLTSLPNYFAVSLSYRQQSGILVKAAQAGGWATPAAANTGGQWAIVTANSGNFDDATNGITAALDAAHISYKVFRIDQSGNYQAQATQMGQTLALDGYKTVYTLTAPGWWVFQVGGYYAQNPTGGVTWVGPGVSFSDFVVAQLACSGSKGAVSGHAYYLAPNPGLDRASAAFKAAAGSGADDIAWSLWGLNELIYQALQKVAPGGLTRQNFINTLAHSSLAGGADVPAAYNGTHFGGTGAWEQKIDCSTAEPGQSQAGTWDTVGSTYLTP